MVKQTEALNGYTEHLQEIDEELKVEEAEAYTSSYIKIGYQHYRKIYMPIISGSHIMDETTRSIEKWSASSIKEELEGIIERKRPNWRVSQVNRCVKLYYTAIKRYTGFITKVDHLDYQEDIRGFYNRYEPFAHTPKEGDCPTSLAYVKHIFGEHYEMGLDYMALLFLQPWQTLPILCLVSQERGTGKTTFLNWLKAMYRGNMTINTNSDLKSQFNSDWATKLIIAVDETFLDRKEDSERIKNLSTANVYKSEAKGKDRAEIPFFGKIILCSNNEDRFVHIDEDENRYWVRKVSPLPKDLHFQTRNEMLERLVNEIPAFLHYLKNRQLSTQASGRMWFSSSEIRTDALENLKKGNKSIMEQNLEMWLSERFDEFNQEVLYYTATDLMELPKSFKVDSIMLRKILKKWGLTAKRVQRTTYLGVTYTKDIGGEEQPVYQTRKRQLRFYEFKREEIHLQQGEELETVENTPTEELPF